MGLFDVAGCASRGIVKRLSILLTTGAVLVAGCKGEPAPTALPAATSQQTPNASPLDAAVARWRQTPALSGRYRAVYDTAVLLGSSERSPDKRTMLQIHEGTFAKQGTDRFRATGTQRLEYTDRKDSIPTAVAEVDLLFSSHTLIAVNRSSGRIPPTAQVMRIGPALFEDGQPFKLKTVLNGSAFGQGDVATTVETFTSIVRFARTETATEDGETLTAHVGRVDQDRAIDRMVAERHVSLGMLLQMLGQAPLEPSLLDLQLKTIVGSLLAQEHVRVLVDKDGMLRGWDVGPAPGTWAASMRLSRFEPKVAADAFVLAPALEQQAVDQTPALLAQTESLRKSFDDEKSVARARTKLRDALQQARVDTKPQLP